MHLKSFGPLASLLAVVFCGLSHSRQCFKIPGLNVGTWPCRRGITQLPRYCIRVLGNK